MHCDFACAGFEITPGSVTLKAIDGETARNIIAAALEDASPIKQITVAAGAIRMDVALGLACLSFAHM